MSCIYRYKITKEHRCPVCGRGFSILYGRHGAWKYRLRDGKKGIYLCGYTCYQQCLIYKKEADTYDGCNTPSRGSRPGDAGGGSADVSG